MQRRLFLQATGAACAGLVGGIRLAMANNPENLPAGPIVVVVPFSAGGPTDISTRAIIQKVQENTGISIIVENKPGGGTRIGTEAVIRAVPNGKTLIMLTNNLATNETFYKGKLRYNLDADLAPISLTHSTAHTLLVHPSVPADSFKEFIDYVKKNPGQVAFGSAGVGTTNHLCGEYLKSTAGIDMLHVPYQGISALMPDLYSGRIQVLFASLTTAVESVKDKRLKLLAVTTKVRQEEAPDVPAISEYYPGFEFSSWIGYAAPGKTPDRVIEALSEALNKAIQAQDVKSKLPGFEMLGSTPDEFRKYIHEQVEKSAEIIEKGNIKL